MHIAPAQWAELYAAPHKVEYKVTIDGTDYFSDRMQGNPVITKPLLDKPAIGRVCTSTLTVVIRPIEGVTIPRGASAQLYCRLVSTAGDNKVTDWVKQGQYNICSRSGDRQVAFVMRDDMIKAGQTYLDKTKIESWPIQQTDVLNDIVRIMGVEVDNRTVLKNGSSYRALAPDSDTLISEVLSYIAASNCGNWIITEEGKLRLVPLTSPAARAQYSVNTAHRGFTETGIDRPISRITFTDSGDGIYTAGDDTGYELTVFNPYADQTVADEAADALVGVIYRPYRLDNAKVNPLLELGDTVSVTRSNGSTINVVVNSATVSCNVGYYATLETKAVQDGEEEFPYQTAQEIQAARSLRSDRTYYGTSLNKGSGLVVRRIKGDAEEARVTLNADQMVFQQGSEEVLYFDVTDRKWKMSASMEILVKQPDGSFTTLDVLADGLSSQIKDVNGRTLEIKATVDGVTISDPKTGETLINGGAIYTDNLFLHRLFSRDSTNSYVEMLENGLNFILGNSETIGIGYYSADKPQPYMLFGAGNSASSTKSAGMVKKYGNGIWVGDSADKNTDSITKGTGIFVDTSASKIYKYVNGIGVEFADTSNVVAVFG